MLKRMASALPSLREIERLSPRVIRILGGNPGKFTLQGTNTYLIGKGSCRILIDTGEGKPSWAAALKSVLEAEKATVETTILTHWHVDHISGVSDLLSQCPNSAVYKHQPAYRGDKDSWHDIESGQRFNTEGASLRAFHCPGHTQDHMAFILEEENAMFTGDNVLGHGTAVFEDLAAYMASLDSMQHEFNGKAYPGHGEVIEDGNAKIKEYIAHREQRELEVLEVLGTENEQPPNDKSRTSMQIVKVVYKDYPENLHIPAQGGVNQILEKLKHDGKVVYVGDEKWKLSGSYSL